MTQTELLEYEYDSVNYAHALNQLHSIPSVRLTEAFEAGYADGREYGRNGMFIPTEWTESLRARYLAGFKRGVRTFNQRYRDQ